MRILLDESLPIELAWEISGHDVLSVQQMGWSGLKNGELLARAADRFEVMVTADQNLPYQQNLNRLPIAVVVVAAQSNRIETLRPLVPRVLAALANIQPCTLVHVRAND
jgi:predicted nuclease of predicted toxin-antitoxin system